MSKKKEFFKEYTSNTTPTKKEIKAFLEDAKKVDEYIKEWDLPAYDMYLADLYLFVGKFFNWSQDEFENTSIDYILYYRDKILESLENNCTDGGNGMPINYEHWALILTMKKLFGKQK